MAGPPTTALLITVWRVSVVCSQMTPELRNSSTTRCISTLTPTGTRVLRLWHTWVKQPRTVTEPCVWKLRVHEKPDLPEAFHERRIRASLTGSQGPLSYPWKNEFGIGGDAISRCLEGLSCTLPSLLSRYSVTFSILYHPHYFCANFNKIWEPHFQKVEKYVPPGPLPVALPVAANTIYGVLAKDWHWIESTQKYTHSYFSGYDADDTGDSWHKPAMNPPGRSVGRTCTRSLEAAATALL